MTCTVKYAIRSAADGRVSTAVTVTGSGADKWQLSFALPDGQKLLRGWSHGWAQDGQSIQVTGTGLPVKTGFDSSYRTATTLPAQFRLNGTVCQAQMSVAGRSTPPTTAAADGQAPRSGRRQGLGEAAAKPARAEAEAEGRAQARRHAAKAKGKPERG